MKRRYLVAYVRAVISCAVATVIALVFSVSNHADEPRGDEGAAGPQLGEVQASIDKLIEDSRGKLQSIETDLSRQEATARQVVAVKKAYAAETVTLDQLLEAQRRHIDARLEYLRAASGLSPSAIQQNYLATSGELAVWNEGLAEAQAIWKKVRVDEAKPGPRNGESKDEAQAREQYFLFKSKAQAAQVAFQKAEKAFKAAEPAT